MVTVTLRKDGERKPRVVRMNFDNVGEVGEELPGQHDGWRVFKVEFPPT